MKIIPVIDLLNGVVVHAKQGARQHYLPIQSQLTPSHQPLDIVAALLNVYPFQQLYIADLDAIQKLGTNYKTNYNVIAAIQQRYPALELWVDAGVCNTTELNFWQKLDVKLVISSENFARIGNFLALKNQLDNHFILSLDYFANGYRGPTELLQNVAHWPQEVIIMTLANVGVNQGVAIELLQDFKQRSLETNFYAAGGVRHNTDLHMLINMGIKGALVASAIHQKQIDASVLASLKAQKN